MRTPAQWELTLLSKAHGIRKWTWLVWSLLAAIAAGLQLDTSIHERSWNRALFAALLLGLAVSAYFDGRARKTAAGERG